jgi:hypothetical protein
MSPSHASKGHSKYRYYISSALLQGTGPHAGSVRRVPATAIEARVIQSVRDHLKPSQPIDDRSLINIHVARVEVRPDQLVIHLAEPLGTLEVQWRKTPARRRREILLPEGIHADHARPMRSETRARLVVSIARGRRWLDELITNPTASAETIATRENCSTRKDQHDDLAGFPCPRSRQGRHRWPAPAGYGRCSPYRLAGRMVPTTPDARPSRALAAHSNSVCANSISVADLWQI